MTNKSKRFGKGLIFKLGGVLLLLLFIKLLMISVGIYSANHLKGDATAINYAGSERMRSYKLSYLINKWLVTEGDEKVLLKDEIDNEINRFDMILKYLREGETGDGDNRYEEPTILLRLMSIHPFLEKLLELPGIYEPELKSQIEVLHVKWFTEIKPLVSYIVNESDLEKAKNSFISLNVNLPTFVDKVDHFVALLEDSSNRKVRLFMVMQYFFLLLTIIVTLIALYIVFLVTKRSVHGLMEGIRSMTAGDFSTRVSITSSDEMGELAEGFNFMAEKLEELYGNLEDKVEEKTSALEERNRELSILYNMLSSLNKALPLDDILHTFLNKLQDYLDIQSGAIRLLDDDGSLRLVASMGLDEGFKANISFGECLCGILAHECSASPWNVTSMSDVVKLKSCRECEFSAVVEIPIMYKEHFLGVVNLFQEEIREFSASEKLLVESLNNHLGAAIEYYNLNAKTKRLAIVEERNMLASELHDSIAQALAYLKIQGNLLDESLKGGDVEQARDDLRQIRKGVDQCNQDVRELLVHFRTKIESAGLEATIKKILAKFGSDTGIKTEFKTEPDIPVLSPDAEVHIFHIVQEALTNARKYAEASEVKVQIKGDGNFGVVIEDNGRGFSLEEVKAKGASHVGMDIMRERAARLGGELQIDSDKDRGTSVSLSM